MLPLVFSIFFDDVFALPKTAFLWVLAALVGIFMGHAAMRGARPVGSGIIDLAAAGLVLLSLAATILSSDPGHSLIGERFQYQGLLTITAYVVLFFAARYAVTQARQVRILSLALLTGGLIASAYGLAQLLGLDPIWSELWKGRIFSTMGQANMLAAFLGTAVVMAIPLATTGGRGVRVALSVALGVITLTLALTFGRGGYLALVGGLAVAGAVALRGVGTRRLRRYGTRVAVGSAVTVLLLAALAVTWPPAGGVLTRITDRVATIVDPSESSNQIRLDLWTVAVVMTAEHPVLGTGPDSYALEFPEHRDKVLPTDRAENLARFRVESPHNVYLAIASGTGLPALGAFLVLVVGCLLLGARAALRELALTDRLALAGLMAGTTVVLVANGFMTGEPATSAIWFVLIGALAGVGSRLRAAGSPA